MIIKTIQCDLCSARLKDHTEPDGDDEDILHWAIFRRWFISINGDHFCPSCKRIGKTIVERNQEVVK